MRTRSSSKGFARKPDAPAALEVASAMHDLGDRSPCAMADRSYDRFQLSMASSEISLEAVSSVSQITAGEWDACANPERDSGSLAGLDTLASSSFTDDSCLD